MRRVDALAVLPTFERFTRPDELLAEIAPLLVSPVDMPRADVVRFATADAPLSAGEPVFGGTV